MFKEPETNIFSPLYRNFIDVILAQSYTGAFDQESLSYFGIAHCKHCKIQAHQHATAFKVKSPASFSPAIARHDSHLRLLKLRRRPSHPHSLPPVPLLPPPRPRSPGPLHRPSAARMPSRLERRDPRLAVLEGMLLSLLRSRSWLTASVKRKDSRLLGHPMLLSGHRRVAGPDHASHGS